jgi:hypothetical protein
MLGSADRCNVRGCILVLLKDAARRFIMVVIKGIFLSKENGTELAILPNNGVCCTKVCYNAIIKSGRDSNRGAWDSDGRMGPRSQTLRASFE